jgi:hypothetical protein
LGSNQLCCERICCSGGLQHVNSIDNSEAFACSITIAIGAFGKDKVRYKEQIPI